MFDSQGYVSANEKCTKGAWSTCRPLSRDSCTIHGTRSRTVRCPRGYNGIQPAPTEYCIHTPRCSSSCTNGVCGSGEVCTSSGACIERNNREGGERINPPCSREEACPGDVPSLTCTGKPGLPNNDASCCKFPDTCQSIPTNGGGSGGGGGGSTSGRGVQCLNDPREYCQPGEYCCGTGCSLSSCSCPTGARIAIAFACASDTQSYRCPSFYGTVSYVRKGTDFDNGVCGCSLRNCPSCRYKGRSCTGATKSVTCPDGTIATNSSGVYNSNTLEGCPCAVSTPICSIPKITGVSATPVNGVTTWLQVSWSTNANASFYKVQYRRGTSGSWSSVVTRSSPTTIAQLQASTLYQVRVQGVSSSTTGAFSNIVSATTNKRCGAVRCDIGSRSARVVAHNVSCGGGCPPTPTIQNPTQGPAQDSTYSLDKTSCNIDATFSYTGGNKYRPSITEGTTSIKTFPEQTYSTGTTGVTTYTLKPNDYNKTYNFVVASRRTTDPTGTYTKSTKSFTTPARPHPKSNFTIENKDDGTIQLRYTPEGRTSVAGLRFKWEFSEIPTFHNGTHQNSFSPIISFSTTGEKTITLTITDTALPTTNKECSTEQTIDGETGTIINAQQMESPVIEGVSYELLNAPACTPSAKLTYTSSEELRTDILQLYTGNTQIQTDRQNVSIADTRFFSFPIQPDTEYRAVLTTRDFAKSQTKADSNPVEYIFTTPDVTTYPTANFTYTVNPDATLQLNYTGNSNSIRWHFSNTPTYIQGSATSKSVLVSFPSYGTKTISVVATSSASELNSCIYSVPINVQPATRAPIFPIIREVPPIR